MQGDEKTSHLVQHKTGSTYVDAQGWLVVGTFEDLDVSAISVAPQDRPDLGPWLTERADDWDALVVSKTDRLFRSAKDSVDLTHWAEQNRKILVFVDDGLKLDFYHPANEQDPWGQMMTKIFVLLSSIFAEMEGRRFLQRARDRTRYLRTTDRWGHGRPPYGFTTVEHPSGKGRALAHEPEQQRVIHDMARLLLEGSSLNGIAIQLNNDGVPCPKERTRKEGDPYIWHAMTVLRTLTSPGTQGLKHSAGKPILDGSGEPIQVGPPSFEPAEWDRIQQAVAERAAAPRTRTHSPNALLGVAKCTCGANLRLQTKNRGDVVHRYYRCGRTPRYCLGVAIRADVADAMVEVSFLELCGDQHVQRRVWQAGEDHSYELDEVTRTIDRLREDRALGLYTSPEDESTFRAQMRALVKRRDDLAAKPVRRAGWVYELTPRTYRQAWADAADDPAERRRMLVDAGVELVVPKDGEPRVTAPANIRYRTRKAQS